MLESAFLVGNLVEQNQHVIPYKVTLAVDSKCYQHGELFVIMLYLFLFTL